MNDIERAELAKLKEELARVKTQLREVTERLSFEGNKLRVNVRDETADGMIWVNLQRHKWWVIGALAVIVLVVVATMR